MRQTGYAPVLWLFGGAIAIYLVMLAALALAQRSLMYFPAGPQGPAAAFGLADAETLALKTADGETIVAWYQPAARNKPLFLYFHGNGGTLATRVGLLHSLAADGSGFLAIDYRGYGGSTGSPSEAGFLQDGEAAYAAARTRGYAADRLVIIGESIGTGVAVALAARQPIKALVLDSAFSSTTDVAGARYWMFPVRLLMMDRFDSLARIGKVAAPKLFLHSAHDPVIPIAFGRKLFAAAGLPKTFIEVPGTGHVVLWKPDVLQQMKTWLEALPPGRA